MQAKRGRGGVDGQSREACARPADAPGNRRHTERRADWEQPRPGRHGQLPQAGQPGACRTVGIPTLDERVCQPARRTRGEAMCEPGCDDANGGERRGRSSQDARRTGGKEIRDAGRAWSVDADLQACVGSGEHQKRLTLVTQRVAEGRGLRLRPARRKAGSSGTGRLLPSARGTPPGGVIAPLRSHIRRTPVEQERRRRGYRLTREADDGVVTGTAAAEARAAGAAALRSRSELGVPRHPQQTRSVRVRQGCECLGYQITRGTPLRLPPGTIRRGAHAGAWSADPREQALRRFRAQGRQLTTRRVPRTTQELSEA